MIKSDWCRQYGHPHWAHECHIYEQNQTRYGSDYLSRAKMLPVEGQVYCLTHGTVHDDTLNPYDEDSDYWCTGSALTGHGVGKSDVHREVFYRGLKGDLA